MLFLQELAAIAADSAAAAASAISPVAAAAEPAPAPEPEPVEEPAPAPVPLSLWQLCVEGGWVMILLALLLVISIYVFVERFIVTYKAARYDEGFMKRIKDYIHDGETESALNRQRSICARPTDRLTRA